MEGFELSGGFVPAGSYGFREGRISYSSNAARTLSGEVRVSGGGYFQGDRRSVGGSLVLRPHRRLGVDVGVDHNVIDLTGDAFTADVFSGRVDFAWSTRLLAGAWVQYNDARSEMVTNVRLNYIHAPLSDVFLVYSERRSTDGSPVVGGDGSVLDRRLTLKVTKLFGF